MNDKHNEDDMPQFDMPPLRMAAVQLKEMYDEFRASGFTRSEALTLVAKIISGSAGEMQ